jgi:hypothetical protein
MVIKKRHLVARGEFFGFDVDDRVMAVQIDLPAIAMGCSE